MRRGNAAAALADSFIGHAEGSPPELDIRADDPCPIGSRAATGNLIDELLHRLPELPTKLDTKGDIEEMLSVAGQFSSLVAVVQEAEHPPGHRDPHDYLYSCFFVIGGKEFSQRFPRKRSGLELLIAHPGGREVRDENTGQVTATKTLLRPMRVEGLDKGYETEAVPLVVLDHDSSTEHAEHDLGKGVETFHTAEPRPTSIFPTSTRARTPENLRPEEIDAYGVPKTLARLALLADEADFWRDAVYRHREVVASNTGNPPVH